MRHATCRASRTNCPRTVPSRAAGVHLAKDPRILAGQRGRHLMKLLDRSKCEQLELRCSMDAPVGAAAPFSLPSADNIRLFDFYCAPLGAGADGVQALREAGVALRKQLPFDFFESPPEADDPSRDGTEYLVL